MEKLKTHQYSIDPYYKEGRFYKLSHGDLDATYKVQNLKKLIQKNIDKIQLPTGHIADIGCGTGMTSFSLHQMFTSLYNLPIRVDGYDVHPFLPKTPKSSKVVFYSCDFREKPQCRVYDLAVLFDVIEHVPDPISFIRDISRYSRILAFHIPLDDSLFCWIRNLPRLKLSNPGHIILLKPSSAINLLTFSGLRIIDFDFSPVFDAPTGKETIKQKLMLPLRKLLYWINPYITQRILAGVSISVLAWTPHGLSTEKK